MSTNYSQIEGGGRRSRSLLPLLIILLIAFFAGSAAMGWLLVNWGEGAKLIGVKPPPDPAPPLQTVIAPEPAPEEAVPHGEGMEPERIVIDPEIVRRVSLLEQRILLVDSRSRSAVGNADRAEGLLVAFAARRALDRGVGLGYLEGLLRQRFGATQPQAVATIITQSRRPVTLEELQNGLQKLEPNLSGGGPNQGWWQALKTEFGGLVTIRKTGTPSQMPSERFARATQRLEAGQVDVALAEVLRMPARDAAIDWINGARRYVAARRALDTIETAALLEPRGQLAPGR